MQKVGFYFMLCPDYYLLAEELTALKTRVAEDNLPQEINYYWADEGLPQAFWASFASLSFEPVQKIVVIRQAQSLDTETWKKLSTLLANVRKDLLPIFCLEVDFEKGQAKVPAIITKLKCYEFATKQGWVWQSSALDENKVLQRLLAKSKLVNIKLEPSLAKQIAKVLLPEACAVDNAVRILELASTDGQIKLEYVDLLASGVYNFDIFSFIQNMQNGRYLELWQMYMNDIQSDEERFFPFLALLTREAKILWQLLDGDSVRLPPYVLDSKKRLAQSLGREGLQKIFACACKAEWAIKTGQKNIEQCFEELIAYLTTLFSVMRK